MDSITMIGTVSIITAGFTITVGTIAPAISEGRSIIQALIAIAQQPDEAGTLSRTLFVGLAIIESIAIYCFVVAMIIIFANPFWGTVARRAGGG
jgi:F-type H+-transporting ATPase subunit c